MAALVCRSAGNARHFPSSRASSPRFPPGAVMQGEHHQHKQPDVVLVGAGIMSATLGVLLKELDPQLTISIFESLDQIAAESSNAWNNAGTGHAALCELNYTPERADGSVETKKALEI